MNSAHQEATDKSNVVFSFEDGSQYDAAVYKYRLEAESWWAWSLSTSDQGQAATWRGKAAYALGQGMHCMMDIWAHGNIRLGRHFAQLDKPDWQSPWEKAHGHSRGWRHRRAVSRARSYLKAFVYLREMK